MHEQDEPQAKPVRFDDETALLQHFGVTDPDGLVEMLDDEVDAYVSSYWSEDGLVLEMTTPNGVHSSNLQLTFPMSEQDFWDCVYDLEREVMGE